MMTNTRFDQPTSSYDDLKSTKHFLNDAGGPNKKQTPLDIKYLRKQISELCSSMKKQGVFSATKMNAVGLKYTGKDDTTRCEDCGLEISNWTLDMDPFEIHSTRSPNCPSVRSIKSLKPSELSSSSSTTFKTPVLPPAPPSSSAMSCSSSSSAVVRSASISSEQENPSKRQKTEANQNSTDQSNIFEVDSIQQIRKRTFSHWPHRTTPSQAQMIEAGFFNCNVGDRVICIYCNLICQQWTPHTDDPCEVHKTLSPNCPYVKAKLLRSEPGSILIVNESTVGAASNNLEQFRCNEFVPTAACNAAYSELPKRTVSFATWPADNLPSVDDLVKAGFFYTGTKNIVTCFYCNGSLQNWGPNDNPTIEHARWFPHCAYAKQLCGDELYRKIQESKRAQQGLF
jgi:baculoviral IAP repeat-containing protein 2/3